MNELLGFAQKWCHPDYPPLQIDPEKLLAVGHELGVSFPDDYRSAILTVGLPHPTLALLNNILERNSDLHDLSNLYSPEEILSSTKGWHEAGMPGNLIAIGNDCSGSSFCFDANDLKNGSVSQAPVYFWDHDFDETERIEVSFSSWIGSYLGDWSKSLSYSDF